MAVWLQVKQVKVRVRELSLWPIGCMPCTVCDTTAPLNLIGGVGQWLGRRSLTGGLSLIYACLSLVDVTILWVR